MRSILLFAEDYGHEAVISALLRRLQQEYGTSIEIGIRSATGGYGKVISEIGFYFHDLRRSQGELADLIVVATDANCKGIPSRKREIEAVISKTASEYVPAAVYAIPDPHVERWLLLDSGAFKSVLGLGCPAPDRKCERDRYKQQLITAVRNAGVRPTLGGLEYAEEIVAAMDLAAVSRADDSFGMLVSQLRKHFDRWKD